MGDTRRNGGQYKDEGGPSCGPPPPSPPPLFPFTIHPKLTGFSGPARSAELVWGSCCTSSGNLR